MPVARRVEVETVRSGALPPVTTQETEMYRTTTLAFVLLAGIGIGAAGVTSLQAQNKGPGAYAIIETGPCAYDYPGRLVHQPTRSTGHAVDTSCRSSNV